MARPSLIPLALGIIFQHLLSAPPKPLLASYKLTYRCNLRCEQCPFPYFEGQDSTFTQVCAALDTLYRRGDRIVIFEGGEPLLWRDPQHPEKTFGDIVRYARNKFACVGVTTNGTLPIPSEPDVVWVSVDGFAETHNALRRADIFERVIDHIRQSNHTRLYAHITANAVNHAEIPELVRYLSGLVRGITVQFYYPYGSEDRLFLPWTERRALIDRLIDLKISGYPILNSTGALKALRANTWRCLPERIDCANPDGTIWQGCYLRNRAERDCKKCGFSPYTEMSLAFRGHPGAIWAGYKIFL